MDMDVRMPGSVLLGILALLSIIIAGSALLDRPRYPKSSIVSSGAIATRAASPGGVLIVRHGITGACPHRDGGRIIARARALNDPYDVEVKEIRVTDKALAPGGALARWRMPERFPAGQWQGSIRVWCFGVLEPIDTAFYFSVEGEK